MDALTQTLNKDSWHLDMDAGNLDKDISRLGHLPGPGPRPGPGLKPESYIFEGAQVQVQVAKSRCLCPNPGCQC